jgi:peptidoglycan/LPS O-acetylase OafA/YrhL
VTASNMSLDLQTRRPEPPTATQAPEGTTISTGTSTALANLRGFAVLCVIAFHSFIAYIVSQPPSPLPFDAPPYGWLANPIVDSARWIGFDLFCAFLFLYMMQLMFLLSGLFVAPSLQRKGEAAFLYDRFLRLGAPFVLGVYLMMPLAYYPVYRLTAADPSWSTYWVHFAALPFWPSGPLWFLWVLLAFNIVATLAHRLARGSGELLGPMLTKHLAMPRQVFLALLGVSALAYVPAATAFSPWQWIKFGPFGFQPVMVPQYAIYFFAGVTLGAFGIERGLFATDGMLSRGWSRWVAGAAGSFLLWIGATGLIVTGKGGLPGLTIVAAFGLVLFAATACLAFMAVFLRFAATPLRLVGSISEHAYGMYLFHYLFVIWMQYALLRAPLPAVVKGVGVFGATVVLSWAATAGLSRVPIVGQLVGGGRRSAAGRRTGGK